MMWVRDILPTYVSTPISVPQPTFALHTDASLVGFASTAITIVRLLSTPSQIPGVPSVQKRQLPKHSLNNNSAVSLPVPTQAKLSLQEKGLHINVLELVEARVHRIHCVRQLQFGAQPGQRCCEVCLAENGVHQVCHHVGTWHTSFGQWSKQRI